MKRKILMFLSFIFAVVTAMAVLAACGGGEEEKDSGAEAGTYYCDVDTSEYTLELGVGGKCVFTLKIAADTVTGKYDLDKEALSLIPDSGETIEATLKADTVTLVYKSVTYSFLKKIEYTVQFDTDGNGTIASATVINGKTVAKPQDPVKDDWVFIAWYTDREFRSAYDFSQPVRGDLTLYARFLERLNPEFVVTFNVDGNTQTYLPMETAGGVLPSVYLPTPTKAGAEFAGWWVSDFGAADKLTYRYNEQQLYQNTTLFAVWKSKTPRISFTTKGISWEADGVGTGSYEYKLFGPNGNALEQKTLGQTSTTHDFSEDVAGEYRVEVSISGVADSTGYAYLNYKALPKVSVFEVVEGTNTLRWNDVKIAGADESSYTVTYSVSYKCKSGHSHVDKTVTSPSYDFSGCEIPDDGFDFTVKANAEGYISSEATYHFTRTLHKVTSLRRNDATETVTWDAVVNATSYKVTVKKGGTEVAGYENKNIGNVTSLDMRTFDPGEYVVTVTPVARGWFSPDETQTDFTKTRLATPTGITLRGSDITWNAVAGAQGYTVTVNGQPHEVSQGTTTLTLEQVSGQTDYVVTVLAKAEAAANNSLPSDALTVKTEGVTAKYENGRLSWDAVLGAYGYKVKVGAEGALSNVITANYYDKVEFTAAGEQTIYVYPCVDADGTTQENNKIATAPVTVYAIHFNVGIGYNVSPIGDIYKAYGDPIDWQDLTPTRSGYDFLGWYTAAEGGDLYVTEDFFHETSTKTLYAHWEAKAITITFEVDPEYGEALTETRTIRYEEEEFFLPIPNVTKEGYDFLGWYTEEPDAQNIAQGVCYADGAGRNRVHANQADYVYPTDGEITLYASFGVMFIWAPAASGDGLRVSFNTGRQGALDEVTIPYTHNGERVTEIASFANIDTLKKVNIPSTIQVIDLGGNTAAFRGCSGLEAVEVYTVPQEVQQHVPVYSSQDGALYQTNDRQETLLVFVPMSAKGQTDGNEHVLTVKDGTSEIVANAFRSNSTLTEVVIPASVTSLVDQSFSNCSALKKITFTEPAQGASTSSLTITDGAFVGLSALETITLPSTIVSFSAASVSGCSSLKDIIIGSNNQTTAAQGKYFTNGGLLYKQITGGSELVLVPAARDTLTIASGVISIGDGALGTVTDDAGKASGTTNSKITTVEIPASVQHIGRSAFRGMPSLTTVTFRGAGTDQDLTIDEYAFYGIGATIVTLPGNLTTLGAHAFGDTQQLKTVTVSTEKASINFAKGGFGSTDDKYYVEDLTIGAKVPAFNIGDVFGQNLQSVNTLGNDAYGSFNNDGVVYDAAKEHILYFPRGREATDYTTPDTLLEISEGLFKGYTTLESVTIGKGVESIGKEAFSGCTSLTSVTFVAEGTALLTIGESAFENIAVENIALPARTAAIGNKAFANIATLKTFSMPSSVEQFGSGDAKPGNSMFVGDTALETITVTESGTKHYGAVDGILYKYNDAGTIMTDLVYAPISYKPAGHTEGDITVNVGAAVTKIWEYAFEKNQTVKQVTFAQETYAALTIGEFAFNMTTALEEIHIPEGVTEIPVQAFYMSTGLKTVELPHSLTLVNTGAFARCINLETVSFRGDKQDGDLVFADGGTVKDETADAHSGGQRENIGVFGTDTSDGNDTDKRGRPNYEVDTTASGARITSFEFPEGLTKIGSYAFASMRLGTQEAGGTLAFPSTLQSIGESAFYFTSVSLHQRYPQTDTYFTAVTFADDCELKTIGKNAFKNSKITTIDLPDGVTEIVGNDRAAEGAFYGSALTNVTLPESLEKLGGSAFRASALASVTFNNKITTIEGYAFAETKLTAVEIPASVTGLGTHLFEGDTQLTTVTFASGYNSTIPANCFEGCSSLATLSYEGATITSIGANAFMGCGFTTFTVPASVTSIGNSAFEDCASLKSITWDEGSKLTRLGTATGSDSSKVFSGTNAAFTSLSLPVSENNITLGRRLFEGSHITQVNLSKSVENVVGAFSGAPDGLKVTVDADSTYFFANDHALYNKAGSIVYYLFSTVDLAELTIEEGTPEISAETYKGQVNITSVYIPASVTVIGKSAFENCVNLQTVTFEDGSLLEEIGEAAFKNCVNLTTFDFTALTNLEKIGSIALTTTATLTGAFQNCRSLESADLSACSELTTLGDQTFINCSSLTYLEVPASLTSIGQEAFRNCISLLGSGEAGHEAVDFSGCLELSSVGGDASHLFEGCASLREVKFYLNADRQHTALTAFGTNAKNIYNTFADCTSLVTVSLPDTLTWIPEKCFMGCVSLTSLSLPTALTKIGKNAFENCEALDLVQDASGNKLPSGLTELMEKAFQNSGITSVNLPAGLATGTFGNYAFSNAKNLVQVTFADAAFTKIPAQTFFGCENLTRVTIPGTVTEISANAFRGTGLTSIVIPKSVTAIKSGAFAECASLKTVTFEPGRSAALTLTSYSETLNSSDTAHSDAKRQDDIVRIETTLYGTDITKAGVFENSGLTAIDFSTVGNTVTITNDCTFALCKDLKSITWGTNLVFINGDASFAESGIEHLTLPSNVYFRSSVTGATYGKYTFYGCEDLTSVTAGEGFADAKLGYSTFYHCSALETVDLSKAADAFTETGTHVFEDCTALETVKLPTTLEAIGESAFAGCKKLADSNGETGISLANVTSIGKLAFADNAFTTVTFGTDLETLDESAFSGCNISTDGLDGKFEAKDGFIAAIKGSNKTIIKMTDAVIKENVITVPDGYSLAAYAYAFDGITADKVILPKTLTTIPAYAFAGSNIKEIEFTAGEGDTYGLTTIENYAFTDAKFSSVTLPAGNVMGYAFYKAQIGALSETGEGTIDIKGTIDANATNVFEGCTASTIVLPESVTKITSFWFKDVRPVSKTKTPLVLTVKTATTDNALPNSITTISNGAFRNSAIKSLTLPSAFATAASGTNAAFLDSDLEEVTITGEKVPNNAFFNAAKLKTVNFSPAGTWGSSNASTNATIGSNAFEGCTALTSIELPAEITTSGSKYNIGSYAFRNSGLQTITLKGKSDLEGIERIDTQCFAGTKLTKFIFPSTIKEGWKYAQMFENCTELVNVVYMAPKTTFSKTEYYTIGGGFSGCTSLTSVKLPDCVKGIDDNAFVGCSALKSVWLPASVTSVSSSAFSDWGSDKTIYVTYGSAYELLNSSIGESLLVFTQATIKYGFNSYEAYQADAFPAG